VVTRNVPGRANGGPIGAYAEGGPIFASSPIRLADGGESFSRVTAQVPGHDVHGSDSVRALLTEGEYVQPVPSVDYYGRDIMEAMRTQSIPKEIFRLAEGGSAGISIPSSAVRGVAASGAGNGLSDLHAINLNFPSGSQRVYTLDPGAVAAALDTYFKTGAAL